MATHEEIDTFFKSLLGKIGPESECGLAPKVAVAEPEPEPEPTVEPCITPAFVNFVETKMTDDNISHVSTDARKKLIAILKTDQLCH